MKTLKTYGNLILMAAICIVIFWVFMALRPAQAGPECVGDVGRCHGYMPAGYIGAHPSNRGVHSCTWSAESRCVAWRASGGEVNSRANGHAGGVTRLAKRSVKRLGDQAAPQTLKPATRNGPGSTPTRN